MYKVYVLKSISHNSRYVGSTEDLENRIAEHNQGRCRYTKGRMPWLLVYSEEFSTLSEARKREVFLKSGKGREFLDRILTNK
jgi:putative endonuclease